VKPALQRFKQLSTEQQGAIIVGAISLVALLFWGGWMVYEKIIDRPATPEQVKRSIWKYLARHAGTKNFEPSIDLAALSLSNLTSTTAGTTTVTNKAGKVKTVKAKPPKGTRAELPDTALSSYFRTNHAQAPTYAEMYKFIGQQLTVTEKLLDSPDAQQKLTGLVMASEASSYARTNVENVWLCARICQAYLWPNLALVEKTNRTVFTADTLLNLCDLAFQEAGETNNIIRNYEYMIAKVSRSPAYVDLLRYRLAHVYQDLGQEQKALPLLKQIKNYRMNRVPQEAAAMEQRLKRKR
jgi:hypothetical protein